MMGRLEKQETGNRNPESGIGTGMGTESGTGTGNASGTLTVMWKWTDTRTGTSFTLIYFNSNSIYTKNKKNSRVSGSPLNLFILRQRGGNKAASLISSQQLCECIALSVNFFTVYAQLRREMIKSLVLLRTWTPGDKFYCVCLRSDAVSTPASFLNL